MLSIIIPVYNVEKYISKCMETILCQDGYPYEVILVNDGSTDKSGEICDSFAGNPRVKVIHKENGGTSTARNIGIEVAKGDYLWFVDPDDWVDSKAITTIGKVINQQDMIIFGAFRATCCDDGSFQLQPYYQSKVDSIVNVTSEKEYLFANCTLWNKIFSRRLIGSQRFTVGIKYGQDAEFYYRLIQHSMKVTLLPDMLYYYYVNRNGNVVNSFIDERINDFLRSAIMSYNTLKDKGWSVVGISRINNVIGQVLNKISSLEKIKKYKRYIKKCNIAARYPSRKDKIEFFLSKEISIFSKAKYLSSLINPWHARMYLMIKSIIRN